MEEQIIEIDQKEPVKRGGCLSAMLILIMVVNPLTSIFYLFNTANYDPEYATVPVWAMYSLAVLGFLNAGFAWAVWNWKKIGVYGFLINVLAIFAVNLAIGVNPVMASLGFIGPALLIILVKPVWKHLE